MNKKTKTKINEIKNKRWQVDKLSIKLKKDNTTVKYKKISKNEKMLFKFVTEGKTGLRYNIT